MAIRMGLCRGFSIGLLDGSGVGIRWHAKGFV